MLTQADYNESYFNGGGPIGGYDLYSETTYASETYAQLAIQFRDRMAALGENIVGAKVLDVGCAYGFLVKHLLALGVDAYGLDWSSYAISQAPPEVAGRVFVGDASVAASYTQAKTLAGLSGGGPSGRFALIVDVDMLMCNPDAQATAAVAAMRDNGNYFVHVMEESPHLSQWYNYKTIAQWKTFAGGTQPKEKWYKRLTWEETT